MSCPALMVQRCQTGAVRVSIGLSKPAVLRFGAVLAICSLLLAVAGVALATADARNGRPLWPYGVAAAISLPLSVRLALGKRRRLLGGLEPSSVVYSRAFLMLGGALGVTGSRLLPEEAMERVLGPLCLAPAVAAGVGGPIVLRARYVLGMRSPRACDEHNWTQRTATRMAVSPVPGQGSPLLAGQRPARW